MNLEYGDVLFVKNNKHTPLLEKFSHWAIKKITKSPYYHIIYFINGKTGFEADGFRNAGFVDITDFEYDVKRLVFSAEERRRIMLRIISTSGARYDWGEIFSLLLRKGFGINVFYDDKNKYICSGELFSSVYRETGILLVDNQFTSDVSPADLWNSEYLIDVK